MRPLAQILILILITTLASFSENLKKLETLIQEGKVKEALTEADRILSETPNNRKALACRIDLNVALRKWDHVITDLTKLIKIFPEADQLLIKRAMIHQLNQKYDKALKDLLAAEKLNPYNENLCLDKARLFIAQHKVNKAVAELTKTLTVVPTNVPIRMMRAELWVILHDIDNALVDFNRVLKIEPKNTQALNSLAWFMATWPDKKYRNGKRSIELATRACEISEWKNVAIIDTLAAAYAENNQFDKAVEYSKKALADSPTELLEELKIRLEMFKQGRPHRETPSLK